MTSAMTDGVKTKQSCHLVYQENASDCINNAVSLMSGNAEVVSKAGEQNKILLSSPSIPPPEQTPISSAVINLDFSGIEIPVLSDDSHHRHVTVHKPVPLMSEQVLLKVDPSISMKELQVSHSLENVISNTPFGINRFVILIIMVIYATCIGTHLFNWTPWEKILEENGAFSNLCDTINDPSPCVSQQHAIGRLLLIATVSMFSCTLLAGLVLDIIGSKICCIFGNLLLISGWVILALSPGRNSVFYNIGFMFVGAGADPSFFGILSISNLFPGYSSTIISILGGARSLNGFLPLVLAEISAKNKSFTFTTISLLFMALYCFCLLVVLFFVPFKPYLKGAPKNPSQTTKGKSGEYRSGAHLLGQQSCIGSNKPAASDATNHTSFSKVVTLATKSNSDRILEKMSTLDGSKLENYLGSNASISPPSGRNLENKPNPDDSSNCHEHLGKLKIQLGRLFVYLKSFDYLPIVLISIASLIRNNFYLTSARRQLGSAESLLSITNSLAFIPGPILGLVVDKFGPLSVIFGNNTLNLIVNVVLIIGETFPHVSTAMGYISVVAVFPVVSFFLSQIYCYIATYFPTEDMGKLAGFASFIGGLFGLLADVMNQYSTSIGDYRPMNFVGIGLAVITYAAILFLCWRIIYKRRKNDVNLNNVKQPMTEHA